MLACLITTAALIGFADPPKANAPRAEAPKADAAKKWIPQDKEMVVLLGSAFIEQEARDGYLETELIRLYPEKDIRVRNLGWSGDTVHCNARSYFGPPEEGFQRLREHLKQIKPTTVICCYGANESWKGEPGIPEFRKAYERLLDMIVETTKAKVVLMTPPPFEPKGDAEQVLNTANVRLTRYWQETRYMADARKTATIAFGEQYGHMADRHGIRAAISERGVEFTPVGYRSAVVPLAMALNTPDEPYTKIDFATGKVHAKRAQVSNVVKSGNSLEWTQQNDMLPSLWVSTLSSVGEVEDRFDLKVDGKVVSTTEVGFSLDLFKSDKEQTQQLRQAIVKKNQLFFHRWRPANETYLYGFRKHEQGNNGVEPPMFDKLVEEAEAEIAKLKKPRPHKYELIRVEAKK